MSRVMAGDAARLLSKLDQLSDEEVSSLLESMLAGEQLAASPAPTAPDSNDASGVTAAPAFISSDAAAEFEALDERELLDRLDQLSDEEVAALLGEVLAEDERANTQASVDTGTAAGEVSVDQLTDDEVTRLLGELLGGKGEAE